MNLFKHDYRLSKQEQLSIVKQDEHQRISSRLSVIASQKDSIYEKRDRLKEGLLIKLVESQDLVFKEFFSSDTITLVDDFVVSAFPIDANLLEEEKALFVALDDLLKKKLSIEL